MKNCNRSVERPANTKKRLKANEENALLLQDVTGDKRMEENGLKLVKRV